MEKGFVFLKVQFVCIKDKILGSFYINVDDFFDSVLDYFLIFVIFVIKFQYLGVILGVYVLI